MKTPKPPQAPLQHPLVAWGLWLAMAGAPLLWSNAFVARFTLPKFFALALGVLVSVLGMALSKGPFAAPLTLPILASLLASAAALGLSAVFSQDRLLSLIGRYDSYAYGLWPLALYAAVFVVSAGLCERRRRQTLRLCLIVGAFIGFYAALQGLGFELFSGVGALPHGRRAVSTLGSPVDLGAYLAALLPLALNWALKGEERTLGWAFSLSISAGILATISRGAWLGAAAGCAVYFSLESGWERLRARLRWILPALAAAGLLAFAGLRFSSRQAVAADSARLEVFRAAWHVFLDHPWLGTGPDTFEADFRTYRSEKFIRVMGTTRFQAYAHNDVLQAMATTGLAGTAAYAALLLSLCLAAKKALDDPTKRPMIAALCGGLAGLFVILKVDPVSIEVLVTAAVLAGLLCPPTSADFAAGSMRNFALACSLVLSAFSAVYAFQLVRADIAVKEAARLVAASPEAATLLFQKGIRINPCELSYHIAYINHLGDRVNAARTFEARKKLLADAEALKTVSCHPNDVNAHYIRGILFLVQGQVGMKERFASSAQELDAALRGDASFLPILRSRLQVAQLMGDKNRAQELEKRISYLTALGGS